MWSILFTSIILGIIQIKFQIITSQTAKFFHSHILRKIEKKLILLLLGIRILEIYYSIRVNIILLLCIEESMGFRVTFVNIRKVVITESIKSLLQRFKRLGWPYSHFPQHDPPMTHNSVLLGNLSIWNGVSLSSVPIPITF